MPMDLEIVTPPRLARRFLFLHFLHAVLVVSVLLAAGNLMRVTATLEVGGVLSVVASAVWLWFVLEQVRLGVRSSGSARQCAIDYLGELVRRCVVRVEGPEGERVLRFGYYLFGRRHYFTAAIPVLEVVGVTWSKGQRSALAGRDADDWSVVVWNESKSAGRGCLFLSPDTRLDAIEAFGARLVEMLRGAGATALTTVGAQESPWPLEANCPPDKGARGS